MQMKETVPLKLLRICVATLCLSVATASQAEISVVDVELAESVQDREPFRPTQPPAQCLSDAPNETIVPSISTQRISTLYLWTKLHSAQGDETSVRVGWFKDGLAVRVQRTEMSWRDRTLRFIEWVAVGLGWKELASVELRIRPSSGWRTWSTKELDRYVHAGKWRADIATIHDEVLCSVHFNVVD